MAILNYKLFEHKNQQLWIGGGIKLPTGKFEIDANDPDIASAANNQLGSGSTDFLLNAAHNLRINKWAINTQALYKINSTNKEHYRFGNRFTASSLVSYTLVTKAVVIRPNAGMMFEHTEKSQLSDDKISLTGGHILQGIAGVEFNFQKISFGMNVQLPVAQYFAEDQTKQKVKAMAHVSFAF